jgi:hypothetical protein
MVNTRLTHRTIPEENANDDARTSRDPQVEIAHLHEKIAQ